MVYYYKKKIPNIDDIVIARVEKISELGIEVNLNEYNDIKGFINCSEVSRKKKVNFNKLLTVGKDVLLNVIQVDKIKNFIDLSKRTISDEDIKNFTENHKLHIHLYNIFKYIFVKLKNFDNNKIEINQEELYNFMCGTLFHIQLNLNNDNNYINEKILYKDTNLEILNFIDLELIDNFNNLSIEKIKDILDEYIGTKINRIKPQKMETIKLMTYSITGLSDLKYTLDFKTFPEYSNLINDFEIKINYITGSIYSIIMEQKNYELEANINIDEAFIIIKKEIKKRAIEKYIQNQILI